MATGDLTAEQQVERALYLAQEALLAKYLSAELRSTALLEIREASKRIAEARGKSV